MRGGRGNSATCEWFSWRKRTLPTVGSVEARPATVEQLSMGFGVNLNRRMNGRHPIAGRRFAMRDHRSLGLKRSSVLLLTTAVIFPGLIGCGSPDGQDELRAL